MGKGRGRGRGGGVGQKHYSKLRYFGVGGREGVEGRGRKGPKNNYAPLLILFRVLILVLLALLRGSSV